MSARTFSLRFLIAATATVAATSTSAQQKPGAGPTKVIVRAWASGEPITDLKPADLTIRVDGKQREVRSLDLVKAAPADAAAPAATPATPAAAAAPKASALPAPFATSSSVAAAAPAAAAAPGSREFMIVLDDESIAAGQEEPVRKAVAKIMAEASPADRFGVVSLRMGGIAIEPTTNREAITDAFAKFNGGGSVSEKAADLTCRAQRAIGSLGSIYKASTAGRTLVIISPGIAANMDNNARMMGMSINSNDAAQTCMVRSNDMEELTNAANASPANAYVLFYGEGMAARSLASAAQAGLENVAGATGAEFIRLIAGTEAAISRIPKETAVYYIATLDEGSQGNIRRIDARISRDGAKVHARPAGATGGGRAAAAPASAKSMQPRDMAMTTTTFNEVPLRAAGFVTRQGTDQMKIVTLFEPVDPAMKITQAAVALVDASGKATLLTLKPEELNRSPILAPQLIKPGKYRVRVAAKTAEGNGGTVDFDVEGAIAAAGPLTMSELMLGVSTATGVSPRLQFASSDAMAVGIVEVYGVPKAGTVTAEVELLDASGASQAASPAQVAGAAGEDARMVGGGFNIATLAPGDYTLSVKVSLDGKLVGTRTRTLRKAGS